jgi:hypothetical protein
MTASPSRSSSSDRSLRSGQNRPGYETEQTARAYWSRLRSFTRTVFFLGGGGEVDGGMGLVCRSMLPETRHGGSHDDDEARCSYAFVCMYVCIYISPVQTQHPAAPSSLRPRTPKNRNPPRHPPPLHPSSAQHTRLVQHAPRYELFGLLREGLPWGSGLGHFRRVHPREADAQCLFCQPARVGGVACVCFFFGRGLLKVLLLGGRLGEKSVYLCKRDIGWIERAAPSIPQAKMRTETEKQTPTHR